MKHIHKTKVSTYIKSLADLGVDNEEWVEFAIVLSKVNSYRQHNDNDGAIDLSKTIVYTDNFDMSIIDTPYKEFDKIMTDYLHSK